MKTLSQGYQRYNPGSESLRTKVFFSSGTGDTTSPLAQQNSLRASIQRIAFIHIRHETFVGRHAVKRTHVAAALRWFRE